MTSVSTDRRLSVNAGAAVKVPVKTATTAALASLSGLLIVDGYQSVDGDRVLVKNQADATQNGIYLAHAGAWTYDADWAASPYNVKKGTLVFVTDGATTFGFWRVTSSDPLTPGTSSFQFAFLGFPSSVSVPLSAANGGTGGTTAPAGLAGLGVISCTAVGGTANAITCTVDSTVTAYSTNQIFELTPTLTNTGATTLTPTPSGAGALPGKNIFANGAACVGGELVANVPTLLLYDGVQLNIIGYAFFRNNSEDFAPDASADYVVTYDTSAKLYRRAKLQNTITLRSYLAGLGMSTAGGSTTMTIAAGQAADSTNAVMMNLAASIGKTTGAWAVGNGNGGLDTGAIANSTWYHFYEIMRSDTGVVDVLFSLSASAPTMPANYTYKRRIGSGKTDGGGNWTAFTQDGDYFRWSASVQDVNAGTPGTAAVLRTLTVPTGVNVYWVGNAVFGTTTAATNIVAYVSDPAANDEAPTFHGSVPGGNLSNVGQVGVNQEAWTQMRIRTNTAAQVRTRGSFSDGNTFITMVTLGWEDRRGRDA